MSFEGPELLATWSPQWLGWRWRYVMMVLLLLMAAGCKPKCENCQRLVRTLNECLHLAADPNGTPCSTTACIENNLNSASCQSFPDRRGDPECNTDLGTGPEVVQRVRRADCPSGVVNWTDWVTIYWGCGNQCNPETYQKACETNSCTGLLIMGPFNRGQRKQCGCP